MIGITTKILFLLLLTCGHVFAETHAKFQFNSVQEQANFMLWGLFLVLGILSLLWGVCNVNYAIARWVESLGKSKKTEIPAPATQEVPATQQNAVEDTHRLIVLLTAAAQETLGAPIRIVHFKNVQGPFCSWASHGRSAHHSSHQPR